ncbi:MAG: insulinase family protein, partial [Candidatus Riflebacteria bacterium]|nr:insulinase family protein [Candidatus Riflebacteria bacterium]
MILKKFIFVCLAMSFLCTCCFAANDNSFDFSALEKKIFEATLDNGLKLIIVPNHDAPVVSMTTWANVGGSDDPKGYSGLAHMFEHMAFKGTTVIGVKDYAKEVVCIAKEDVLDRAIREERSKGLLADQKKLEQLEKDLQKAIDESYALVIPNEFTTRLQSEGAIGLNAFTSADQTAYIMSLPSNKLELWIAMEAERFLHPVLREMYKERMVIQEERRM